jgi:hypothetical protein
MPDHSPPPPDDIARLYLAAAKVFQHEWGWYGFWAYLLRVFNHHYTSGGVLGRSVALVVPQMILYPNIIKATLSESRQAANEKKGKPDEDRYKEENHKVSRSVYWQARPHFPYH